MSQLFQGESDNFGGGKEKTVMVEGKFDSVQQVIFNFSPPQIIISSNASLQGWGASCQGQTTGGMVRGGTKVSHKCIGFQGHQTSCNVLHIKGEECNIGSHLHKAGVNCDQQRSLTIPFETKDYDYCRILTRISEGRGRQGIHDDQGFQGMEESKLNHLQEIVSDKGNTRNGSVCLKGVTPITHVHVLENRPFQSG